MDSSDDDWRKFQSEEFIKVYRAQPITILDVKEQTVYVYSTKEQLADMGRLKNTKKTKDNERAESEIPEDQEIRTISVPSSMFNCTGRRKHLKNAKRRKNKKRAESPTPEDEEEQQNTQISRCNSRQTQENPVRSSVYQSKEWFQRNKKCSKINSNKKKSIIEEPEFVMVKKRKRQIVKPPAVLCPIPELTVEKPSTLQETLPDFILKPDSPVPSTSKFIDVTFGSFDQAVNETDDHDLTFVIPALSSSPSEDGDILSVPRSTSTDSLSIDTVESESDILVGTTGCCFQDLPNHEFFTEMENDEMAVARVVNDAMNMMRLVAELNVVMRIRENLNNLPRSSSSSSSDSDSLRIPPPERVLTSENVVVIYFWFVIYFMMIFKDLTDILDKHLCTSTNFFYVAVIILWKSVSNVLFM